MKKIIIVFALLGLINVLSSCSSIRQDTTPVVDPQATPSHNPSSAAQGLPHINLGTISGATPDEIKMITEGFLDVNKIIQSPCFKSQVLAASYTENLGLTQTQIYQKLANNPVTVNVVMYTGSYYTNHVSKTVGYETVPGTINMNRYFVNTAYMVGDNASHEGEGHSQGFMHNGNKSTSEPYGMNAAYEACAESVGVK